MGRNEVYSEKYDNIIKNMDLLSQATVAETKVSVDLQHVS